LRIAHGALLNLAGHAAPLAAALVAVPVLLRLLGTDRFGFLALAWALVGYFSFFDLGLGRALSRMVAERKGTPREAELAGLSGSTLTLTLVLGAAAGAVLFVAAPWLCASVLKLPPALVPEAVRAMEILAACLPLVTLTAALRGLLEGGRHFGWVNAIRVPLGILTFAAPLAVAARTTDLAALCSVLLVVRLVALAAHWVPCARLMPSLSGLAWPSLAAAREVASYGLWVTVSNVVGSLMVYIDRFVIGAQLTLSAVAFYAAPFEIVTRIWIIPAALTGALFPAMAGARREELSALYRKGLATMLGTAVPVAVLAGVFAPQWLSLWLGPDYAAQSVAATRWLAAGVAINCAAQVPFALLQARGRPDSAAKAHVIELPFYLAALFFLVPSYGIEGAAIAWCARSAVDAIVMFGLGSRRLGEVAA
jgi:O-antigen/teichoic acid export membrane protein